jgi:hypothetical protein
MLIFSAMAVFGQGYKGSVRVTVKTSDGSPLPGAVTTLSASTFNRSFVSDANGEVRFVGLTPDRYELRVVMSGFNTVVRPAVIVDAGANVRLSIVMEPSTQTEELVVTAETPLMDATQVGTKEVLTTEEIELIPQARDPWAVMDSIPGLQTDRINIGGNESGQQGQWVGKGDDGDQAAWVIDGVEFTDFAAEGASQSYLDFGSFAQIGFETGGTGVESGSGGTVINFVTKQGSNKHTGSMRLLWADENFSSTNVDGDDPANRNADGSLKQNTVFETFEKGFEIGGPIIKDRLWYWGAFNQNNVKNITRSGQRDDTDLENISLKLHGDITATTRATVFYTVGDKLKFGRGAGPTRAPETTWNQDGPSPIYKFEVSQLVGQNTELQLILGRVDGGFQLQPIGGFDGQAYYDEFDGRWENTIRNSVNRRPQRTYLMKGSTYLTLGGADHDFTYGIEYKEATSKFLGTWGGEGEQVNGNVWMDDYHYTLDNEDPNDDAPSWVYIMRDSATATEIEQSVIYIQDQMTFGNWTLRGGLRYTKAEANNIGADVRANPLFPEILPALNYNGDSPQFDWSTIAPQISATYTFGDDNQYFLRGSYRKYYDNISVNQADFINPVSFSYVLAQWDDKNRDQQFTVDEVVFEDPNNPYLRRSNVNINDPALAESQDKIDPNLDPPESDEFIVGAEWSITPNLSVGGAYTYRVKDNFVSSFRMDETTGGILDSSFWEVIYDGPVNGDPHPVTGETVNVTQYALSEEGYQRSPNAIDLLTNNPGYEEVYHGLEFTITKRMSNRWMMRGHLSWQDWTHNVDASGFQNPNITTSRGVVDGGPVLLASGGSGSKGDVYLGSATYTAYLNGVYQLPWDVSISGSVTAREGYAAPLYYNERHTGFIGLNSDGTGRQGTVSSDLSAGDSDLLRMDDIFLVNLKLSKLFTMGSTKVTVACEVFNATNDDAIIQQSRRVDSSTYGRINETLAPRIARFSATINF